MGYNLTAEMFSEWAVGLVVVAVRLYARFSVDRGIFRWDDFCLVLGTIFWTLLVVFLYLCTDVYGSNIGLNDTTAAEVPDDAVSSLRKGSIYAFLAWLAYILMRGPLAESPSHSRGSFIFLHLHHITPFRSPQLSADSEKLAGQAICRKTDLCIMCVPIPLILIAKIPTSQKWILCGLFSSGIFVMVAASLRAYYSVKELKTLSTALGWASRQAFVSAIIVCAPGIKPLLSRFSWFASYSSSRGYDQKDRTRTTTFFNSKSGGRDATVISTCEPQPYELSSLGWKKNRRISSGESQEHIMDFPLPTQQGNGPDLEGNTGIMITTHVTLAHEDVSPDDLRNVSTTPPLHH
ncbi:hypothetical protein ASPCADRAFT_45074 [Aspergillus carbonarius ITEM 5010]|uniref:Rhodopsin domain-containing protein n=1 Tax=Aspergillus carbonarius (strain ITEM 5010) TaxID=602072 RepID=A0A1R3RT08_ASPC5|nr:hypothetical protein ASPCADRAFT_45074 [Aspergillus carbonarius ITEM 5010]